MSSVRYGGVRFALYPEDHEPRHAHGFAGDAEVIIDLRLDGTIGLADRDDAVRGAAKRSDVRKILEAAAEHCDELVALWEQMHGENATKDNDNR